MQTHTISLKVFTMGLLAFLGVIGNFFGTPKNKDGIEFFAPRALIEKAYGPSLRQTCVVKITFEICDVVHRIDKDYVVIITFWQGRCFESRLIYEPQKNRISKQRKTPKI
jgi:hypothetical protein